MTHEDGNWMNDDQKSSVEADSLFPIMGDRVQERRGYVPMAILRRHQAQALRNHSQTVERLRERGGLDPQEALATISDQSWRERKFRSGDDAWNEIRRLVALEFPDFDCETGMLAARQETPNA